MATQMTNPAVPSIKKLNADNARSRVHHDALSIKATSSGERRRMRNDFGDRDCGLPAMTRSIRQIPVNRKRLPSLKEKFADFSFRIALNTVLPWLRINTCSSGKA